METYIHKVQYYETDKMGIAHHSNYFRWMEEARGWLLEKLGCPYTELEKNGIFCVVNSARCDFINSVTYGDDVEIQTEITFYHGIRISIKYRIFISGSGKLAAEGETSHSFVKSGGIARLKRDFPVFDAALESAVKASGLIQK